MTVIGEETRAPDLTQDDFLGGRLSILQPRKGHRSGIEAVLIAAMTPLQAGETLIDIGSGVGAASLCALARVAETTAIMVEADQESTDLARQNAERNAMAHRVRVVAGDVAARGAAGHLGLTAAADHAIANPPFYVPAASRVSPTKAHAHAASEEALDGWIRFAVAGLKPGGSLTLVHRAEALTTVLNGFAGRFGAITVLPVLPRPGRPATRIVVQGRKGSRAPLAICPGLVLHGAKGHGFEAGVEAILRDGAAFELTR